MRNNRNHNPCDSFDSQLGASDYKTQMKKVYQSFYESPKSMKEVYVDTGVLREFICWYCRTLRKQDQLFFTRIRRCSITGQWVKEFTTNENFVPNRPKQLGLFGKDNSNYTSQEYIQNN